jgi:hypothetical protein
MNKSDAVHPDVIVGELTLEDGQRQADVAHMALLTPPRRSNSDRRSETLLVFLDLGDGAASGLARAMVEHFSRTYWRTSGPVTSALRGAVDAANAHLREENRLVPVSHRRRAGLVCAVLRDDFFYLAQIGPARALLVQDQSVTWFDPPQADQLPLGVSSGLDLRFAHSKVSGGDRLLLTGESWSNEYTDGFLEQVLRADSVTDVMAALEGHAGIDRVSALVVECAGAEEIPAYPSEPNQSPLPAVARTSSPDSASHKPVAADDGAGELSHIPESVHTDYSFSETFEHATAGHWDVAPPESEPEKYDTFTTSELEPAEAYHPSERQFAFSVAGERLRKSRRGARRLVTVLSDGVRSGLTRVLPDSDATLTRRRRHAKGTSVENVSVMAGIAVAIPLLVAFLVVTFYLQRSEDERQDSIAQQVRESLVLAQQAEGESERALWSAALTAAESALKVAPEDQEILAMRDQARTHLDELDAALRPLVTQLWDYGSGYGQQVAASRTQVYVLDTAQNEVKEHDLDQSAPDGEGEKPTLVTYGDQVVAGVAPGSLRDIVWLSAAGPWTSDALLILTGDNRLLQHSPTWGLSWTPFESELAPENVRVLRPYDGKLYALDPLQNEVWRFRYAEEAFGPPEAYFRAPAPNLSEAIDMAVDGAIYILLGDGQILKFFGGEPEQFTIRGLPQGLSRPVALISEGDADSGALYVADAGTQSIVAVSKNGEFIHQIKADGDVLANLEALALDKDSRTLFALANGRVLAFALPALPEPDAEAD